MDRLVYRMTVWYHIAMNSKFLFTAFSLTVASQVAIGEVKLNGPLGERLETMIENHVVARDVDYITAPFFTKTERQWRWQNSGASGCTLPFRI